MPQTTKSSARLMVWSKCRFRVHFNLQNGYFWRHYATGSHDPLNIRNMALVAHIGVCCLLHLVQALLNHLSARLGENHAHGIYTFKIFISLITWHCRHRKHDYRFSSC